VDVGRGVAEADEVGTAPADVGTGVTVGTGVFKRSSTETALVGRC